jgi:TRAP-type C4-dicarboxylate transport system permease small subunit|tara:strand:- start:5921 stop:6427 length:507 start_codon:yes stop_codon:yes gene_type:complete
MIESINRWLMVIVRVVSGAAFVFMMGVAFIDSIGSQFNRPLLGVYELVEIALMLLFFSSMALVVREDSQIRVGLLADLYKPRLARIEKYFTGILEVIALCVLCWMVFDQASRLQRFGTVSTYFRHPMAPWVFAAAIMTVIAVWFGIQQVWQVRKGPTPRPHALPDEEK